MAKSNAATTAATQIHQGLNVVNFSGLRRQLEAAYKTKCTMYLTSDPGAGKTTYCLDFLRTLVPAGGNVWYYNAGDKTQEFVGGVMAPFSDNAICRLLMPEHFGLVKPGDCMIVDEFDKCPHGAQNIWLEIFQNKSFDGRPIGGGNLFIAVLANDVNNKSGSYGISPLPANRGKSFVLRGTPTEYLHHMLSKGVHHFVAAYLNENQNHICPGFNPQERRNATPRSWMNLSTEFYAMGDMSESDVITTAAGFVPDSMAHSFSVFHELAGKLVPVSEIMKNPAKAKVPEGERGLLYMQLVMVASHVLSLPAGPERGEAKVQLWTYAKRKEFPAELFSAIVPCISVGSVPMKLLEDGEYSKWSKERRDLLAGVK